MAETATSKNAKDVCKMSANKKRKLNTFFGTKLYSFEQINFEALKKIETIHLADGGNFGGLGVYMRTLRAIKDQIVSAYTYPFKE